MIARVLVYAVAVAAILVVGSTLGRIDPHRAVRVGADVPPGTFDENADYRLTTVWQGPGKSLGVGPATSIGIVVRLIPTGDDPGQHWRLTPLPGGYYRLTTRRLGDAISLERLGDDRAARDVTLRSSPQRAGPGWRIVAERDGHYRLLPGGLGDAWSLDIANDGRANDQPVLARTGDYSGQYWTISRLP